MSDIKIVIKIEYRLLKGHVELTNGAYNTIRKEYDELDDKHNKLIKVVSDYMIKYGYNEGLINEIKYVNK